MLAKRHRSKAVLALLPSNKKRNLWKLKHAANVAGAGGGSALGGFGANLALAKGLGERHLGW